VSFAIPYRPRPITLLGLVLFCALHLHAAIATQPHPGRILILPRSAAEHSALTRHHAGHGRRVLREFPRLGRLQLVQCAKGESIESALACCQTNPLVAWAEPDFPVSAAAILPNDPHFQNGTQWWLNNYGQNNGLPDADLDAPEAWELHRSATNIVVAILDTGVRSTHEDLAANLWRHPIDGSSGFNALAEGSDPWDDNGHGTHLAGIVGAVGNNGRGIAGTAWHPRLMICKFLDSTGNGFNSDAIACVEFARANGAHVLNLSWGGAEFSLGLSNALLAAAADGLVVAAAAGNNLANTDLSPYYPASLTLPNLVAVGASTRTDQRWNFSSFGATTVHLFAPGEAIFSTARTSDTAYETRHGTSMAAATVTGALALLREQSPLSSPPQLIRRLLDAVETKPAFAQRCVSGGRLNLRRALDHPSLSLLEVNGTPQLVINGVPHHRYTLTTSTNLISWTPLQTNLTAPDGRWILNTPFESHHPTRFYQALPGP
jgi:subtilisin family serine protease